MDIESPYLYEKLPIALQNVACSLWGWHLQRTRFNQDFKHCLQATEERLTWPHERVIEYRENRLRHFMQHCVQTVPYYKQLFAKYGIDVESIRSLSDLQKLPILMKITVQNQGQSFLSDAIPDKCRVAVHTDGTTGTGLRFAATKGAVLEQWAIWWRYWRLHGIQPGTWCGLFGPQRMVPISQKSPPFWRYNLPGRQIRFGSYYLSSFTVRSYVEVLQRIKPPWLHGYPSLLALLADHMLEQGLELGYIPRWITTAVENLLPQQVIRIKRAFGVRPIQHYGMAEAVANVSECTRGKLHVDEDFAAVEFVPTGDGPGYRVIGTNLSNPATPFLRYDIGDIVELDDHACDCGLPGRIVKRIDGRQAESIVLRSGARLTRLTLESIFEDMMSVRESQIYQKTPGLLIVRVVRNGSYSDNDENRILREFNKRVGDEAEVQLEYVDQIQRTARGKLRFLISEIDANHLAS